MKPDDDVSSVVKFVVSDPSRKAREPRHDRWRVNM